MNAWRYSDLLAQGMSRGEIRGKLAGGAIEHVAHGLYRAPQRSLVERLRAMFLILPPGSAVGFHTAATLFGFGVLRDPRIHIVAPQGVAVPDIKGVTAHSAVLPFDPTEVGGLPCMPPDRCAIDVARTCPRLSTLGILDAALRSRSCSPSSLAEELIRHDRLRGVRRVRQMMPYADPRPECLQESQLRSVIIDARLPAPQPQVWVMDDWGDPIFRLDLGWDARKIGAEYDGQSHAGRLALRSDRERHNWLAGHHWRMRYFTDRDLYRRPGYIASVLRGLVVP